MAGAGSGKRTGVYRIETSKRTPEQDWWKKSVLYTLKIKIDTKLLHNGLSRTDGQKRIKIRCTQRKQQITQIIFFSKKMNLNEFSPDN